MPGFSYGGGGLSNAGLGGGSSLASYSGNRNNNGTNSNGGSNSGGKPSAQQVANMLNSYGGRQQTAAQVSNIRSDGAGGWSADVNGTSNVNVSDAGQFSGGTNTSGTPNGNGNNSGNGGRTGGNATTAGGRTYSGYGIAMSQAAMDKTIQSIQAGKYQVSDLSGQQRRLVQDEMQRRAAAAKPAAAKPTTTPQPSQTAAQQQAAAQAAAAKAAAAKAAAAEKTYQTNLQRVTARAQEIGANSIYGTGNLESQRQYNEALNGLRTNDRNRLAEVMSDAREAARAKNQTAQEAQRDQAIKDLQAKSAGGGSRITDVLSSIGGFLADPVGALGIGGGANTVSGTLINGAKWGMRGMQAMGPAGGVLGLLGGMVANNIDTDQMIENLRGYNPNGLGGVTSAGDLAQQAQDFNSPLWNREGGRGQDRQASTGAAANPQAPQQAKGTDVQAKAAISQLLPTGAKSMMEAGAQASNSYLRALHGRYAKYMLSTGATGSGTGLMQRTAGGAGALGGTSGRLLFSTGGANG